MKKILIFFVFLPFLFGCRKEEPVEELQKAAYYKFRGDDLLKILNIQPNSTITYKNQNGDELFFTVSEVVQQEVIVWEPNLINDQARFTYEEKYFTLAFANNSGSGITYHFWRYPINEEQAMNDYYTEYPSEFHGQLWMSIWNGDEINIDYLSSYFTMTINGTNYDHVIAIQSNNPDPIPSYDPDVPERNVNVVYYDFYNGVIGFDDLNNNQWRISN